MITARIAPVWIAMSKTLAFSSSKPSSAPARIRWPVDEIGRNSVRPSTMPMTAALASKTISTRAPFKSADYREDLGQPPFSTPRLPAHLEPHGSAHRALHARIPARRPQLAHFAIEAGRLAHRQREARGQLAGGAAGAAGNRRT